MGRGGCTWPRQTRCPGSLCCGSLCCRLCWPMCSCLGRAYEEGIQLPDEPTNQRPDFILGPTNILDDPKFHNKQVIFNRDRSLVGNAIILSHGIRSQVVKMINKKVVYTGQWITSKTSRLLMQLWLPCSLSWSPEPCLSLSGQIQRTRLSPGAPGLLWALLSIWSSSELYEGASTP